MGTSLTQTSTTDIMELHFLLTTSQYFYGEGKDLTSLEGLHIRSNMQPTSAEILDFD